MRLQVFLSHSGICSRRKALELVKLGKVKVNSLVVTEPSYKVEPTRDSVYLDNKKIFLKEKIYILLNKPKGVTTTKKDYFADKIVMDLLPDKYKHLFPVGRLDRDSTGLLLLTNDGDLSYKLMHPAFGMEKFYTVELDEELDKNHKIQLQNGVKLEGKLTAPCKIFMLGKRKIKIVIHEGRKRQIRRILELFKYRVLNLERVALGNLSLGNLAIGSWRKLTDREISGLKEIIKKNE